MAEESKSTELAEREGRNLLAEMGLTKFGVGYLTSIPGDSVANREMAHNLKNASHENFDGHINTEIEIVNWLVSPVEFTNEEDGSVQVRPLLRLMLADGRTLQTTSEIVARNVFDYHYGVRPAPWKPAYKRVIKQLKGKGPNKFYALEPPQGKKEGSK